MIDIYAKCYAAYVATMNCSNTTYDIYIRKTIDI